MKQNIRNNIKQYLNPDKKLHIEITWRLYIYAIYIIIVLLLISNAIVHYYEHRIFMVIVWFLFMMSYPFSIFLIQWKEAN